MLRGPRPPKADAEPLTPREAFCCKTAKYGTLFCCSFLSVGSVFLVFPFFPALSTMLSGVFQLACFWENLAFRGKFLPSRVKGQH